MIGRLNEQDPNVTVIGAGIAGLLAAYYLDRRGFNVTLLEKEHRAGGLVNTRYVDQGIAESAAHSLIGTDTVLGLFKELGVELVAARKEARAKYIVRKGKLSRFPLHPVETINTLYRAAFVRAESTKDQTLEMWARKHLGSAAHDYLLTPFVRGIYGVQPGELGLTASYPSLEIPSGQTLLGSMLKKRGGGTKKKNNYGRVAPRFGMGSLVAKLDSHLQQRLGSRYRKNEEISSLPSAANLLIATPANAAARLVENEAPELASKLRSIRYTPIVSVTVFVDRSALSRPIEGVGALMPACEDRKCLGILFNSSSFQYRVTDERRLASFTVMMGGTSQPQWVTARDQEIEQVIQSEMKLLLGVQQIEHLIIHRWPNALPQYSHELPLVWKLARETWCATPGRILFGNYTGQISLRGMIESSAVLA